ncbi:MAG: BACON domain-containing protein [Bacteroidales bacterium]|nr:BACON domain-containing protein [Bacteroidales bacterium]
MKRITICLLALLPVLAACVDTTAPSISIDPNKYSMDFNGGSLAVNITANCDWAVESSYEFYTATPSSGSMDGLSRIEIPASKSHETEAIVINFKASKTVRDTLKTKNAKLVITLEAKPFVELSANEGYVSPDGGGVRVSLTANHEWTATASGGIAGLTVKPAEGTFNSEVTISLPENTTGAARSAEVTFTLKKYPDVKAVYTVRQNPK